MLILLLILALRADATPSGAVVTWSQPAGWSCLYRNGNILLECQDRPAGQQRVELAPHSGRDGAYVPKAGDSYQVVLGQEVASARLLWRVWLPGVWR